MWSSFVRAAVHVEFLRPCGRPCVVPCRKVTEYVSVAVGLHQELAPSLVLYNQCLQ